MQLLMLKIGGLRAVNTILGKNDSVGLENNDASDAESSRCSLTPAFPISKMEMKKVYF